MDRKSFPDLQRPRVLVTRPIQQSVIDHIFRHCDVQVHPVDEPMPPELLASAMRDVDGVMPAGVRISKEIIDKAPRLRVVSNIAVGYDNIDVEACNRRHILVTNTAGVLTEATADLAFALLLAAGPASGRRRPLRSRRALEAVGMELSMGHRNAQKDAGTLWC